MKNNKGFTLIELLAVIVVLAIVMVLATTTVLPYMNKARENAFRIEATGAVDSASKAVDLYNLSQLNLKNDTNSCRKNSTICFTVAELVSLGIYKGDATAYSGKVEVNIADIKNPTYTLYFKKNDEYKIIGGTVKNYNENGVLSVEAWSDDYASCDCT